MNPRITRHETSDQGSFGLLLNGQFRCYSGELPDRNNMPRMSCIPEGDYHLVWGYSPHLNKYCYRFEIVPGRSGVLCHPATYMGNTEKGYKTHLLGCVALGYKLGWMEGQKCLLLSRPAVTDFEILMNHQPFTLEIRNGFNTGWD